MLPIGTLRRRICKYLYFWGFQCRCTGFSSFLQTPDCPFCWVFNRDLQVLLWGLGFIGVLGLGLRVQGFRFFGDLGLMQRGGLGFRVWGFRTHRSPTSPMKPLQDFYGTLFVPLWVLLKLGSPFRNPKQGGALNCPCSTLIKKPVDPF